MRVFFWCLITLVCIGIDNQRLYIGSQYSRYPTYNPTLTNTSQNEYRLNFAKVDAIISSQIAIIVNINDPLSVKIGNFYQNRRQIPANNVIFVSFEAGKASMTKEEFLFLKNKIDLATPETVEAYALTWYKPYRVGCMSITTAIAMGYDTEFCAVGCRKTKVSPYFNTNSRAPYSEFGIRPTMMLAAKSFKSAMALINRGISADGSYPLGTGYLLNTNDVARNVRAAGYQSAINYLGGVIKLKIIDGNFIKDKSDVLFYFTGIANVKYFNDNIYLPGAIADHLTSAGGVFKNKDQTLSIDWLEAGATGSYGSVVEPCNFPEKFPIPSIVIDRYTRGETLIEAYWKSVKMPGQGVFVGELLAHPYSQ